MQVGGAQQQGENPGPCLLHGEFQKNQKAKAHQRGKHIEENVGRIADHDVPHARVIAVVLSEDWEFRKSSSNHVGRQHEQRLPYAIPGVDLSAASSQPEFRIISGQYRRRRRPERMRGLQPPRRVGGIDVTRLHHERDQAGRQPQQE